MTKKLNLKVRVFYARDAEVQESDNAALEMLAGECPFCNLAILNHKILRETDHFSIVENRFPYAIWDSHRVKEHLLLLPKQHTILLADLPAVALDEYIKLIAEYGAENYSTYARSADNPTRSQQHHHTHLIKIDPSAAVSPAFYDEM